MSGRNHAAAAKAFKMPERFGFGLEKRTIIAEKLNYDSNLSQCSHKWLKREQTAQTLTDEGKTVWECHNCKNIVATYDWEDPK